MKGFKKFLKKMTDFFNEKSRELKKQDYLIIGILILIYSLFAFNNLGVNKAPQTFFNFEKEGYEVSYELKESTEVSKIRYYYGPNVGEYKIYASNDNTTYTEISAFGNKDTDLAFSWNEKTLNSKFKYLKISSTSELSNLGEIQLYGKYGEKLKLTTNYDNSKLLIDEADTVPGLISYKNSAYFDEIYFARSAYEYVNGLYTNEWVHPPLGKLIQAIPILIFGMTPFAWRLMGCIAGILMIPVMYIFGKTLFKNRKYGLLAALLMMFDNFHFAHTRLGTVDSYLVLFGMVSALFMLKYLLIDKDEQFKKKVTYLGLSGLFFGLSLAVKWTALYLGLGLAIVFFTKFIKDSIKSKKITNQYWVIILLCILFYIIVPLIIYTCSYLFFPNVAPAGVHSLNDIINQTKNMFDYHANLKEGHDFSSKWYSWIIMYKPVWYYLNTYGEELKSTIVALGNPIIWWAGIPAIIYSIINGIKNKKKELLFLLTLILTTWLPYMFIGRCMFMYHFFPTLPFMMLAIVGLIKFITEKTKNNFIYLFYLILVILFFIYFYPVTSGKVITASAVEALRWFDNWIF